MPELHNRLIIKLTAWILLTTHCAFAFAQNTANEPISEQQQELAEALASTTAKSQAREIYTTQKKLLESLSLPPELSSAGNDYLLQVRDLLQTELSDAEFQRDMMHLYARHFTPDEMLDLLKFFRSHTGQKFLDNMPALAGDAGILAQRRATAMLPQLDRFTRQLLEKVEEYYSGSN